jgi:hypothetical protein
MSQARELMSSAIDPAELKHALEDDLRQAVAKAEELVTAAEAGPSSAPPLPMSSFGAPSSFGGVPGYSKSRAEGAVHTLEALVTAAEAESAAFKMDDDLLQTAHEKLAAANAALDGMLKSEMETQLTQAAMEVTLDGGWRRGLLSCLPRGLSG